MSRNGTGTYVLPAGNPVVLGSTISSAVQNNTLSDIAGAISQSISADGQTPITANIAFGGNRITGLGPGVSGDDAATVSQLGITGEIRQIAFTTPPAGWLACDGSAISRATYSQLFAAVSTTWGAGDGSTTFNLPDLRGRVLVGAGTGTYLTARTLGTVLGEESHALTPEEIASHTHTFTTDAENSTHSHAVTDPGHTHTLNGFPSSYSGGGGGGGSYTSIASPNAINNINIANATTGISLGTESSTHTHSGTTAAQGSDTSHNNMQPSAVVQFVIKT